MLLRRLLRHTATSGASPSHTSAIPKVSGTCGGAVTGGGRLQQRVPSGAAGRKTPCNTTFASGGGYTVGRPPTPMSSAVSVVDADDVVSNDAVLALASASHAISVVDADAASSAVSVVDADDVVSNDAVLALASASHAISVVDADADAVSVVDANDAVSDDAVLAFAVLAFASDDAMLAFASASRAQRRRCNRRHVGRRRACVRVAQQQNKIGGAPAGSCSLSDLHVTALITSTFPHVPWRATARLAASSGSITSAKHVSSRSVASNTQHASNPRHRARLITATGCLPWY